MLLVQHQHLLFVVGINESGFYNCDRRYCVVVCLSVCLSLCLFISLCVSLMPSAKAVDGSPDAVWHGHIFGLNLRCVR